MRQLCNVTYAAHVEFKDADQRKQFDRDIGQAEGGGRSKGTKELMGAMKMRQAPAR